MTLKVTPASEASATDVKELIKAMRKTALFQHASEAALFRLAMEMERIQFGPGDVLGPDEGEPQSHLFVVTTGRLARRAQGRLVYEGVEETSPDLTEEIVLAETGAVRRYSTTELVSALSAKRQNRAQTGVVVRATAASASDGREMSTIDIMCPDQPGLVANVASALRAQGLSIDSSSIKTTKSRAKERERTEDGYGRDIWFDFLSNFRAHPDEAGEAQEQQEQRQQQERQQQESLNTSNEQHTAYQVHTVVDATTNKPIEDPGRMRRVEAAILRTLESASRKALDRSVHAAKHEMTIAGSGSPAHSSGVNAFGTLHVFGELPARCTTTAITSGVCWRLSSKSLEHALRYPTSSSERDLAVDIASGLSVEVFRLSNSYSTPLFEQPVQKVNVAAVSVAAAVESYYRSALNAFLNAAIQSTMNRESGAKAASSAVKSTGMTIAQIFPEMHVQIPTRVCYITGFKVSRQWLAEVMEEPVAAATARGDERARSMFMLVPALAPGVLMTPISSILEACNAGHSNPEPLYRRWIRGVVPRCGREIIFGLGLNNLTDWAEERVPKSISENKFMRNALGSITAGVIAGYFSHVPHNLSTMKLLQPNVSYTTHVASLVHDARQRVPLTLSTPARDGAATALALLLPKGLAIRTTQVVGSFVLLNGISHLMDQWR